MINGVWHSSQVLYAFCVFISHNLSEDTIHGCAPNQGIVTALYVSRARCMPGKAGINTLPSHFSMHVSSKDCSAHLSALFNSSQSDVTIKKHNKQVWQNSVTSIQGYPNQTQFVLWIWGKSGGSKDVAPTKECYGIDHHILLTHPKVNTLIPAWR